MPPVVKNLLIINALLFLAALSFQQSMGLDLWKLLGLHYFESEHFNVYQVVTYMFMHGDLNHIFFNMFAVWMFGSAMEMTWGSKRFLIYYVFTGLGAAFLHYLFIAINLYPTTAALNAVFDANSAQAVVDFARSHDWTKHLDPSQFASQYAISQQFMNDDVAKLAAGASGETLENAIGFLRSYYTFLVDMPNIVGASGSLFGILLAFGMMYPNTTLFLFLLPIPIKAKYFVAGYGLIELYLAFQSNPTDNVAHIAHLGGMLFGFLLIVFWRKTGRSWR